MSKQVLDVHQMQHLQELGLDTNNASMCWLKTPNGRDLTFNDECINNDEWINLDESLLDPVPAYTLQDVLDVLPEYIYDSTEQYLLEINMFFKYIRYSRFNDVLTKRNFDRKPIIDAAYKLLVWCVENKFVETNKNE